MKGFKELDERQKGYVYRAGFESFFVLAFLLLIQPFLSLYEIVLFSGPMTTFAVLYIAIFYFHIRKSILDCVVTDKERRDNRVKTTIAVMLFTLFFVITLLSRRGWRWMDADGDVGPGVMCSIILISLWIIMIVEWIQKFKGFEE